MRQRGPQGHSGQCAQAAGRPRAHRWPLHPHQRGEQFEELPVERFETHTRAFIKVEDGCNRKCALLRHRPRPVAAALKSSILAELRQLAAARYREVVLSAIPAQLRAGHRHQSGGAGGEMRSGGGASSASVWAAWTPDMLTPEFITRLAAVEILPPVPPQPAERLHLPPCAGCAAFSCRTVRTGGGPDPRRLREPPCQLYHRLHLRLPRRDARPTLRKAVPS